MTTIEMFLQYQGTIKKNIHLDQFINQRHQATILNDPEQITEYLNLKKVEHKTTLKRNNMKLSQEEKLVLNIISKNKKMSINEIQLQSSLKTSF